MTNTLVYSTVTPAPAPREHMFMVEMEYDTGYRSWSGGMKESKVNDYIDSFSEYAALSDVDHAGNCWCGGEDIFNGN